MIEEIGPEEGEFSGENPERNRQKPEIERKLLLAQAGRDMVLY
jgi:hypothetical protein